jgi:hypothetical protein
VAPTTSPPQAPPAPPRQFDPTLPTAAFYAGTNEGRALPYVFAPMIGPHATRSRVVGVAEEYPATTRAQLRAAAKYRRSAEGRAKVRHQTFLLKKALASLQETDEPADSEQPGE